MSERAPDNRFSPTAQRAWCLLAMVIFALIGSGCAEPPGFRLNAVHVRTIEKEFMDDQRMPDEHVRQLNDVMAALFGTPDDPHFPPSPEGQPSLVDPERLRLAAGPVTSDRQGIGRGLYRQHCSHCHGVTGDGAGPTAAFLNPYPRDFRLGKFKFKSTRLYRAPTDEDLRRVIRRGIAGTSMPSFELLDEAEIDALVDYVKYLSIRGQVERKLIEELSNLNDDEDLIARRGTIDDEEYQYQLELILQDAVEPVLKRWRNAGNDVVAVPPEPRDFLNSRVGLSAFGKALFYGKANCAQCHGVSGLGDGQTENFDEWTNEWLKRANVDMNVPEEVDEFLRLGALPPRKLKPRNLRFRVFRGGSLPEDLFRRIKVGIEGASMPGAPNLSDREIWSLVAYVLEFPYMKSEQGEER